MAALDADLLGRAGRGTTLPAMSGFPWTSLIAAVVPAAAVLAGAALTGRQNNQAGRTAELKADYAAAFVQGVTALIDRLDRLDEREADAQQLVSAAASARAVVDLAAPSVPERPPPMSGRQLYLSSTPARSGTRRSSTRPSLTSARRWRVSSGLSAPRWAARADPGSSGSKNALWRRRRRRYEHLARPDDNRTPPTL